MIHTPPTRGFTLLIAVILSSVIVSVSLALLDITLKQVLLSSAATQSQHAFYNADTALECGLYWDQKTNAFDYSNPLTGSSITCANLNVTGFTLSVPSSGVKKTEFSVPCATAGSLGTVTVYKSSTGKTTIYANGFNSCDASDTRRIERGLRAEYGT